jgi:glycosyltransferase involved in cell wall biosynthesis
MYLDLHDNPLHAINDLKNLKFKLDGIFVKSRFHQQLVKTQLDTAVLNVPYYVIPNGVRIEKFVENFYKVERNPYRMCYTSWYSRGLEPLLKYFYPKLREIEPRAELHVYYGMDLIKDENYKNTMKKLLDQPGVYEYGKQNVDVMNRERHLSGFHLYYTSSIEEIDCIAIKESLVAGCIPIISDENVFKERDGLKWDRPTSKVESYVSLAKNVAQIMNDVDAQEQLRERYKKSKNIFPWSLIAKAWIDITSK